jgi:serine/threonine protein kinase
MLGDASYMPPECSEGSASRPYDIWSLGCVLLELLVWFSKGTVGWKKFFDARCRPHVVFGENADAFHHNGEVEESVLKELVELEIGCGRWADVVGVIRRMLEMEP